MPPDRRDDRQHRFAANRELADEQLALDLEPDDKEEERHEQVVDPVHQRLAELPGAHEEPDLGVPERIVRAPERGVGEHERDDRRDEQRDRAGDLGVQELAEALAQAHGQRANASLAADRRSAAHTLTRDPVRVGVGVEHQLHQHDVEPAVELAADLAQACRRARSPDGAPCVSDARSRARSG